MGQVRRINSQKVSMLYCLHSDIFKELYCLILPHTFATHERQDILRV